MAGEDGIILRRAKARVRLEAAAERIGGPLGVKLARVKRCQDKAFEHVLWLEAVAAFADSVAERLSPSGPETAAPVPEEPEPADGETEATSPAPASQPPAIPPEAPAPPDPAPVGGEQGGAGTQAEPRRRRR